MNLLTLNVVNVEEFEFIPIIDADNINPIKESDHLDLPDTAENTILDYSGDGINGNLITSIRATVGLQAFSAQTEITLRVYCFIDDTTLVKWLEETFYIPTTATETAFLPPMPLLHHKAYLPPRFGETKTIRVTAQASSLVADPRVSASINGFVMNPVTS